MYHNLAVKLTSYFISQNENSNVDEEIAVYGAELLFSSLVNVIIAIIIGLILKKLPETIIFLVFFCPLRKLAGGYHAPSYLSCTIIFNLYFAILLLISRPLNFTILLILIVACNIVIFLLSPVEDQNKPLGKMRREALKKKIIFYVLFEDVIFISLILLNIKEIFITFLLYAFVTVSILLIFGEIKNNIIGGKNDVKKNYE